MMTVGIRLPNDEKKILMKIARQTDTTISQIVRKLIRDYLIKFKENDNE